MKQRWSLRGLVVLIVALMVGAAELLGQREIIFPEIAAIAVGALLPSRMAWNTSRPRILLLIALCAALGVGIVRLVPGPDWMRLTLAYGVAEGLYLCSGTTFAPMLSAAALPVLLGTESGVYLIAAPVLTVLILGCHWAVERAGWREAVRFEPVRADRRDWTDATVRLALVALAAWAALSLDIRFAVAPPLLVAFTELSRRSSGARRTPVRAVAVIALCALAGAACRYGLTMRLGLPLTLAAVCAAVLMLLILDRLRLYLPPAGALCVLPMLIPEARVLTYPLQITVGAALFMVLSLTVFRER